MGRDRRFECTGDMEGSKKAEMYSRATVGRPAPACMESVWPA
jgi:hypothetical protein